MRYVEIGFSAAIKNATRADLPGFLGSTLRGAFGYLLKQAVCQIRNTPCPDCILARVCPYPNVFEGLPPADRDRMRRYPQIPQPFVLVVDAPGQNVAENSRLEWSVRLFGESARYWPYIVHVFRTAGENGIGQKRVHFELDVLTDRVSGQPIDETNSNVSLESRTLVEATSSLPARCSLRWTFHTPVKLVKNERMVSRNIDPVDLVIAGKRRFETLDWFYGVAQNSIDRRFDASEFVIREQNLRRWGFNRFSGRQQRSMEMAGLMGDLVIEGPWGEMGAWLPASPIVHLGKATSFGFGRVEWSIT